MRLRTLLFAVVALIAGLGTATFARYQLNQAQRHVAEQIQRGPSTTAYVLVAARDLPSGAILQSGDLQWQSWPDDRLSDAYLRKGRDDPDALVGAVVRLHIAEGEPVGAGRVFKPGERGFLAAVIGPGMRATSVQLTPTSDVAGLILPGDRVDLILSHQIPDVRDPNAPARLAGETVLSNLRVVAIDQTVNDQDKKPLSGKTATLEVTPKQAEAIEVAKLIGNLSLDLRSAGDVAADGAKTSEPTHTWDSEVSPLMRRDGPSGAATTVTVLRGNARGDEAPAPLASSAASPYNASTASLNMAGSAARGIANAASAMRAAAGGGLVGGF